MAFSRVISNRVMYYKPKLYQDHPVNIVKVNSKVRNARVKYASKYMSRPVEAALGIYGLMVYVVYSFVMGIANATGWLVDTSS